MLVETLFRLIFSIASLFFTILILLSYKSKKFELKIRNKLFVYFLEICLSVIVTEIITYVYYAIGSSQILYAILTKLQCVAVLSWGWILMCYCYMLIYKSEDTSLIKLIRNHKLLIFHLIFTVIAFIVSLFLPVPLLTDKTINFLPVYAFDCIIHYMATAVIILVLCIINFKKLKLKEKIILLILVFEVPAFAGLQNFLPAVAFLSLCNCLQTLLIFTYYENPDLFVIDAISGLNSKNEKENLEQEETLYKMSSEMIGKVYEIKEICEEINNGSVNNREEILLKTNNIKNYSKELESIINNTFKDTKSKINEDNINYTNILKTYDLSKYKVLLVDDNSINTTAAQRTFDNYKLNLEIASSGEECINKIKNHNQYNLILIAHKMKNLDGIETMRVLKNLSNIFEIPPVILITSNIDEEKIASFTETGFSSYLLMPINLQDFDRILLEYLLDNR